MKDFSLLEFLVKNGDLDPRFCDHIKYALDKRVYYYGKHFMWPHEQARSSDFKMGLKATLKEVYVSLKYARQRRAYPGDINVVSNAYFSFGSELAKVGYSLFEPFWCPIRDGHSLLGDFRVYRQAAVLTKTLGRGQFNELVGKEFVQRVADMKDLYREVLIRQRIRAVFIPNDISFYENLSTYVSEELDIPSFIVSHGLPGRYNPVDDNRARYLMVWGRKMKEHYMQAGFPAAKILIAGHPKYKTIPRGSLRFDFSQILVLAKVPIGAPHNDGMDLYDRGHVITYLLMVQSVLKGLGVKRVKVRFHPSANPRWHYQFIDGDFFRVDDRPLDVSLNASTLVIGPTSTIFLEALYFGVNYVIFEPGKDNVSLLNEPLVPPFDGSDRQVPVAKSMEELKDLFEKKVMVDRAVLSEYFASPFDISYLRDLIKAD